MLNIFKSIEEKKALREQAVIEYFEEQSRKQQEYKKECLRNLRQQKITSDQIRVRHID